MAVPSLLCSGVHAILEACGACRDGNFAPLRPSTDNARSRLGDRADHADTPSVSQLTGSTARPIDSPEHGGGLRFANAGWLKKVELSARVSAIAGAATALIGFANPLPLLCFLGSLWVVAAPEPGRRPEAWLDMRRVARWGPAAAGITAILLMLPTVWSSGPDPSGWRTAVLLLAVLVPTGPAVAGLLYVRWLTGRIPDDRLQRRVELTLVILVAEVVLLLAMVATDRLATLASDVDLQGWNGSFRIFLLLSAAGMVALSASLLVMQGCFVLALRPRARPDGSESLAAAPRPPRAPVKLDGDGSIAMDAKCITCGGELRGLAPDQCCLKCSAPVSASVFVERERRAG